MACGKPPEPGRATPPSDRVDFALTQVHDLLEHIESMISMGAEGEKLGATLASAERAIARLKSTGRPDSQIRKIEGSLERLRGDARGALRGEAIGLGRNKSPHERHPTGEQVLKHFADGVSEHTARTVIEGLNIPGHWAHEDFKKELFRVIEANGKIPEDYKEPLIRETAMLLGVCPSAGGLVTAMVTRGQPRGSFARRLSTKGNDAVGAAYEILGTAALCRRVSTPANDNKYKAPKLHIDPANDHLVFGPKAYMNHRYAFDRKIANQDRRTVEGDAQLFKDGREIAIDFKHVKEAGTRPNSKELERQLNAVAEAISHGHYNEYHFVTNGRFADSFKTAVDKVNDILVKNGDTPIAYHENVSSIASDPYAQGEA